MFAAYRVLKVLGFAGLRALGFKGFGTLDLRVLGSRAHRYFSCKGLYHVNICTKDLLGLQSQSPQL